MKRLIFFVGAVLLTAGIAYGKVLESKHDLTYVGNKVRVQTPKITACQFCHTPHLQAHAAFEGAPMWNRNTPSATYQLYGGDKKATAGGTPIKEPGPTSKACLSCHDGTLSVVDVLVGEAQTIKADPTVVDSTGKLLSTAEGYVGVDLSKQHPVGFTVNTTKAGLDTIDSMKTKGAKFYNMTGSTIQDQMECGTCHDPHVSGISDYKPFLRLKKSTICTDCHAKM